jgi:3-oxoacyl-[acyl-carrier-protein] synthase-3
MMRDSRPLRVPVNPTIAKNLGFYGMQYENVCIETIAYTLPEQVVTSAELEAALEPLYSRLRLPAGRLELMTGIRERRFWPPGMLPSEGSILTGEKAIVASGIDKQQIGMLVHGSVCRDHLEPATACRVHHALGLPADCLVYDISNACLGLMNGMLQVANMIELGQIRAGLVVGTESSRPLVETTIAALNADTTLTRQQIKQAVASLTIGSGSAAVLLVDRTLSRTGNRLVTAVARSSSRFHDLCHSGADECIAGDMRPIMHTDSERLMHEGVQAAVPAFEMLLARSGWAAEGLDKTFCHQVGVAHRRLMFEALGIDLAMDFSTVEYLGNTGSVAVPMTAAIGIEQGHLKPGDHLALLGIGSGINVLLLAVEWQQSLAPRRRQPGSRAALGAANTGS